MVSVDVSAMDLNQTLNVLGGWSESFSQKIRHSLYKSGLQLWVSAQLLRAAIMTYFHQLFVDQLNTSMGRTFQKLDLRFHEKVKSKLRNKERRSRSRGVSDSCSDILHWEIRNRVDRQQRVSKHFVVDVVYSCTSTKLLGADLARVSLDGADEIVCKLVHQGQNERTTVLLGNNV